MNDGMKVRIIKNLKERVHPVNDHVALNGVEPHDEGMDALRELTLDGTVDIQRVNVSMPDEPSVFQTLYSLSYEARLKSKVNFRRVK